MFDVLALNHKFWWKLQYALIVVLSGLERIIVLFRGKARNFMVRIDLKRSELLIH